jgi:hypothetical protein
MIFPPMDTEKIILNEIYSIIGVDVTNLEQYPPEILVNNIDFMQGLLIYWSIRPWINTISLPFALKPTAVVNVQDYRPSPEIDWICLGPVGEGRIYNMTSNLMDSRLLGIFRNYFYVDQLQQSYVATAMNTNIGKPEYTFDQVNQQLSIVTGGDAILSIKLAWATLNLAQLPINHISSVAKIISLPYYERVLALRDQVSFESDFTLNTTTLKAKLDLNRGTVKEYLKKNKIRAPLKS